MENFLIQRLNKLRLEERRLKIHPGAKALHELRIW